MKNRVLGLAALAAAFVGVNGMASLAHGPMPVVPVFKGGRHGRSRTPGKINPPGTKIAKRVMKARGQKWKGEVFHGGELNLAALERQFKRLKRRRLDNTALIAHPQVIVKETA